jgi:hypothetical protein
MLIVANGHHCDPRRPEFPGDARGCFRDKSVGVQRERRRAVPA